ncbi:hypothetical protein NDU88_000725 [Pleurodeles waltl]|uniref:Uncharacterized protein n=1 Tax=Pleurodeles waltl TaxID=8319 RepID=A0AAV7KMP6_PLEWA|nr:hypothetical protein NDU88_000725 [Pleurodeles waltl]
MPASGYGVASCVRSFQLTAHNAPKPLAPDAISPEMGTMLPAPLVPQKLKRTKKRLPWPRLQGASAHKPAPRPPAFRGGAAVAPSSLISNARMHRAPQALVRKKESTSSVPLELHFQCPHGVEKQFQLDGIDTTWSHQPG